MLASLIDSCLDLVSGAVLFLTKRAIDNTDVYEYPQVSQSLRQRRGGVDDNTFPHYFFLSPLSRLMMRSIHPP